MLLVQCTLQQSFSLEGISEMYIFIRIVYDTLLFAPANDVALFFCVCKVYQYSLLAKF